MFKKMYPKLHLLPSFMWVSLPVPITFHFGQNFIEEKRLETQLETATHICEDLKNKNINDPDLGKFVHIN